MDFQLVAHAFRGALTGSGINGYTPDQLGEWWDTYQTIATSDPAARPAVFRALDTGGRLTRLLAYDTAPPVAEPVMPVLPDEAHVPEEWGADAAPWLDMYADYSRHWSPRSFDDFHEAIGIWILSTVAARRVLVHVGKPQYTPLCIALAGRSSLHAKTTAAEVGIDLLRSAGLDWLLADDTATPQKFIRDRTQRLPDGFAGMIGPDLARARLRLTFAGQCGWWYDEFGMLLHAMARNGSSMGDFSGLLRRFDDCAPSYTYGTIGRPTDKVLYPYLALLASLTPADLRPLMRRGSAGWSNGFWPRWAFVTPPSDEYRTDRFPPGQRTPPMELVSTLRDWHDELGIPDLDIHDETVVAGPLPSRILALNDRALLAYYQYGDSLLKLVSEMQQEELDSWYTRLPTKALRIALLLASVHGHTEITMAHWARGQAIAERWRESLHRLYRQINTQQEASQEATAEETILGIIERLGTPSVRDIKTRITWLSAGEIQGHVEKLIRSELIQAVPGNRTMRYRMPVHETDN